MTFLQRLALVTLALLFSAGIESMARADDFRPPYCFAPSNPPRVHQNYERPNFWEWDNRRIG